ncbi:hypothetical protein V2J09_006551 [Rumex salicifolius]
MDSMNGNSQARGRGRDHVVVLPFPVIGRTNPILQFAKRLSSKGLRVTVATTPAFASSHRLSQSFPFFSITTISDGPPSRSQNPPTLSMSTTISKGLLEWHLKPSPEESQGNPVRCVIYDSSFTWALGIAREHGIYAAPFFPQSCAVSLIFCHVSRGLLAAPPLEGAGGVAAPGLPVMEVEDLPTLVKEVGKHPVMEKIALGQFENFDQADWQFFNTFDTLEKEAVNWMLKQWPGIKTIGPAIPSMYLDKRLENDNEYGLNLFNSEYDTCIEWLDTKEDASTIFISFGSLAAIGQDQMHELASGLKNLNKPFLWVVRAPEQSNLPPEFTLETFEQGLIVNWCPQLAVLEHKAVGCFFTHCGWNSTLETICFGVPVVAMPQWADQTTNAFFMENVWRLGIRVKANGKGLVDREEIESCLREIMDGKKGEEMRSNTSKWRIQANAVMQEGGTSDKNIEDFVAKIKMSTF